MTQAIILNSEPFQQFQGFSFFQSEGDSEDLTERREYVQSKTYQKERTAKTMDPQESQEAERIHLSKQEADLINLLLKKNSKGDKKRIFRKRKQFLKKLRKKKELVQVFPLPKRRMSSDTVSNLSIPTERRIERGVSETSIDPMTKYQGCSSVLVRELNEEHKYSNKKITSITEEIRQEDDVQSDIPDEYYNNNSRSPSFQFFGDTNRFLGSKNRFEEN